MSKKKLSPVVPAPSSTPATSSTPEPIIRILKVGTCPSLSGKSNLTYHIGHVIAEEGAETDGCNIMFRIHFNSAPGYFSNEWISMASIQQVFDSIPAGLPMTSFTLFSIFKGRSQNTPGFLLAALQHEGFVKHMQDKPRCYECLPDTGFMAEMRKLIDGGADFNSDAKSAQIKAAQVKITSKNPASKNPKVNVGSVPVSNAGSDQEEISST